MEKKITFISDQLVLEGMYNKVSASRGAIITHPHPLYGGDMTNPVVESMVFSFTKKNYSTLRFNFRGVGQSEGEYDEGAGEQKDILAAVDFLCHQGVTSIYLVGYSFGAWVLARMKELPVEISGEIFVSPPLALLPYENDLTIPLLKLVITGEDDEIAPAELIKKSLAGWNPGAQFEIVDFADHFYYGCFGDLEKIVTDYLSLLGPCSRQ